MRSPPRSAAPAARRAQPLFPAQSETARCCHLGQRSDIHMEPSSMFMLSAHTGAIARRLTITSRMAATPKRSVEHVPKPIDGLAKWYLLVLHLVRKWYLPRAATLIGLSHKHAKRGRIHAPVRIRCRQHSAGVAAAPSGICCRPEAGRRHQRRHRRRAADARPDGEPRRRGRDHLAAHLRDALHLGRRLEGRAAAGGERRRGLGRRQDLHDPAAHRRQVPRRHRT